MSLGRRGAVVVTVVAAVSVLAAPASGTTFTKYTVSNSSRSNIALSSSTVTVPSYTAPPDAHQVGTTDLLDTSDSRFVNASTQMGLGSAVVVELPGRSV